MASFKDKYQNAFKELAALKENHEKQNKKHTTSKKSIEKLLCPRSNWNNVYYRLDVKSNATKHMQIFETVKDIRYKH